MNQLIQFIDNMYAYLSELSSTDIERISTNTFSAETIDYLKHAPNKQFNHRQINIRYVGRGNQVWVENLN